MEELVAIGMPLAVLEDFAGDVISGLIVQPAKRSHSP